MENFRLPRFRRAIDPTPIQLTERDIEIVRQVARHRFLRSTHLARLIGGSRQQLLRRLQRLFHHGFLDRPPTQLDYFYRARSEPMVYGLGRKGVGLLRSELNGDGHHAPTETSGPAGRVFLQHALLVSDVMVALETACQTSSIVRFFPQDELLLPKSIGNLSQPFRWSVRLNATTELAMIPDGVFALETRDANGIIERTTFFLEADCGTMPVERRGLTQSSFFRKLLAYETTWTQNLHQSRFGFHRFRVITVTTSAERAKHLVASCHKLKRGHGLFLFTDRASLAGHSDFLSMPWQTARGEVETLV